MTTASDLTAATARRPWYRSIAGNLPGGPINMIREDPVNANVLYAANDFGVYVTTNGGVRLTQR